MKREHGGKMVIKAANMMVKYVKCVVEVKHGRAVSESRIKKLYE